MISEIFIFFYKNLDRKSKINFQFLIGEKRKRE